jgi:hypothetical protein
MTHPTERIHMEHLPLEIDHAGLSEPSDPVTIRLAESADTKALRDLEELEGQATRSPTATAFRPENKQEERTS